MIIENVTYPDRYPITESDVRNWIRYPATAMSEVMGNVIAFSIRGAVADFEKQTNRKLIRQSISWKPERKSNGWFGYYGFYQSPDMMAIPLGATDADNVVIEYQDTDGVTQTFSDFTVVKSEFSNSHILLDPDSEWPSDIDTDVRYPVTIKFHAGWPFGDRWSADAVWTAGEIMIPTIKSQLDAAYECRTGGTAGSTEPIFTTEIGDTQAEGPDTLVWECIGRTVPGSIIPALLSRVATRLKSSTEFLMYPNLNIIESAWNQAVSMWTLKW